MQSKAILRLVFESEEEAESFMKALAADDDGYLTQRREGAALVIECSAETPGALRQSLEDYLSCLVAAGDATSRLKKSPR